MGVIESGALEQSWITKESSYNTLVTTPASTDAVRAIESMLTVHHARPPSTEKRGTPDEYQALVARDLAAWDISSGMWEPSGTLGTASYWGPLLKGGLGAQHKITSGLATTVNAAPSPTATGCTLISATGLAVGDVMLFTVAGKLEPTIIRSIATLAVTYDALSAAPDVPGSAVAGITYSLASVLGDSFTIAKFYNGASNLQAVSGAVVDNMVFTFDGTKPIMLAMKGKAAAHMRAGVTKPGAFTTAGTPLGGTIGSFFLGATAFPIMEAVITVQNNLDLRNTELGTAVATGFYRTQNRKVTIAVKFYFDNTTLLTQADALTKAEARILCGSVNGKMIAAIAPLVEWEIPDVPKDFGPKILQATGIGYATSGNDSLFLAEI